jgi:hypothetical protein
MWWIIGFVALCAIISVIISRRGPGDGLDHSQRNPLEGAGHPGGGADGGGAG